MEPARERGTAKIGGKGFKSEARRLGELDRGGGHGARSLWPGEQEWVAEPAVYPVGCDWYRGDLELHALSMTNGRNRGCH